MCKERQDTASNHSVQKRVAEASKKRRVKYRQIVKYVNTHSLQALGRVVVVMVWCSPPTGRHFIHMNISIPAVAVNERG